MAAVDIEGAVRDADDGRIMDADFLKGGGRQGSVVPEGREGQQEDSGQDRGKETFFH